MSDAPVVPVTAMSKIDEAIEHIRAAQNKADELIELRQQAGASTRALEAISDRLQDALMVLGQ